MKATQPLLHAIIIGVFLSRVAIAGEVFTSDGSKLVGTIEQIAGGKLIILTEIAGRLSIDTSKIVCISSDQPLVVEFETGDRLVGTIVPSDDASSPGSAMHTALGYVPIAIAKITSVWHPGEDSPEVIAIRADAEEKRKALIPNWTVTVEAGGILKEGNTESLNARGRLDVRRKTKDELLSFFLSADYSEQDDLRTQNEYRGGMSYENMLSERSYWYTRLEMEFDEFENLDLRSTAAVGIGYYWLREEDHELKNRLGLGYRHESFNNDMSKDQAVLDLGLDYRVDIAPWLQFAHSTTFSPGLEDLDDYRLDVDTAVILPLKSDKLKLKLGIRNEYNSRPQRGIERLDNTYYANLMLSLER